MEKYMETCLCLSFAKTPVTNAGRAKVSVCLVPFLTKTLSIFIKRRQKAKCFKKFLRSYGSIHLGSDVENGQLNN